MNAREVLTQCALKAPAKSIKVIVDFILDTAEKRMRKDVEKHFEVMKRHPEGSTVHEKAKAAYTKEYLDWWIVREMQRNLQNCRVKSADDVRATRSAA